MKKYLIETNADRNIVIGNNKKWFVTNVAPSGKFNDVDIYKNDLDIVLQQLSQIEIDEQDVNDLINTIPECVINGEILELFPNDEIHEF